MDARWFGATSVEPMAEARRFVGQSAIVTGASSGIGLATSRRLVREGARVVGIARGRERLEATRSELGSATFLPVVADMRDPAAIAAAVEAAVEWIGHAPEVLVNSAGVFNWAPALETSVEFWDETVETDLRGPFLLSCDVVREAVKDPLRGLSIVHIASTAAYRGLASEPSVAYNVAKVGLRMLTEQTALEWAELGVRVNLVVPGVIDTPMLKIMEEPEAGRAFLERYVPQRRVGTADECAALICFVASRESPYMTGASIVIDGGRLLT